jgi:hypothetical protein
MRQPGSRWRGRGIGGRAIRGDTARAARGAGDLGKVSSRVTALMASVRAQVTGEGAGIACALTAGDANSFHAHCDHVHTTVDPSPTPVCWITGRTT